MHKRKKLPQTITELRTPIAAPPYRVELTPEAASTSASLIHAFAIATDALVEIQSNLDRHGLGITLTSDNLTTIGLSLFSNECKKAEIR